MSHKDRSEITIIYDIYDKNINIFGYEFVRNNKRNCKMIIDKKEYEITRQYNAENYNNKKLKIKLIGIDNINDMSYMFDGCSSLSSLTDISKLNINKVTNISFMFSR